MIFLIIAIFLFVFCAIGAALEDEPFGFVMGALLSFLVFIAGNGIASETYGSQDVKRSTVALETVSPGIYAAFAEGNKIVVRYNGTVNVFSRDNVEIKTGAPSIEILDYYGAGTWTFFDAPDKYVLTIPANSLSY